MSHLISDVLSNVRRTSPWSCVYVMVLLVVSTWLSCDFCVPCALVNVLAPPILLPRYWFICPTCFPSIPSLFAFLFSLPVFVVWCSFVVKCYLSFELCLFCACRALFLDFVISSWDLDFFVLFVWFMFYLIKTLLLLCIWVLAPFPSTHT